MIITLNLPHYAVEHLDEVADLLGTTREKVLVSMIEQQWQARSKLATDPCPWELSATAISQYLRIAGGTGEGARIALEAAAIDAVTAEQEGRRVPANGDGTLRYRGPKPRRLMMFVRGGVLVGVSVKGSVLIRIGGLES